MKTFARFLLLPLVLVSLTSCRRDQEETQPAHPAPIDDNHTWDGVRIQGANLGEWTHDWEAAVELGRLTKRPILALFTASDWNSWHRYFHSRVLDTPRWESWLGTNLVLAWINIPNDETLLPKGARERNRLLTRQYSADAFPAPILLNPSTRQAYDRYHVSSETTADEFISWVLHTTMDHQPGGVKHFLSQDDVQALEALRAEREPLKKAYDQAVFDDNKEYDHLREIKTPTEMMTAWAKQSDEKLAALKAPVRALDDKIVVLYEKAFQKCLSEAVEE